MKLLVDLTQTGGPALLVRLHEVVDTRFGCQSADPHTGERCQRCNRLLHVHVWQFVDGDDVLECEVSS